MQQQTEPNHSHTAQLLARSGHSVSNLPSKRRPKPTARYRSYVNKGDSTMSPDDPSSDDAPSPPKTRRRSTRLSKSNNEDAFLQTSDAQTTAPSSPYDADEEDEGERDVTQQTGKRKRRNRGLPRPSPNQSYRPSSGRKSRRNISERRAEQPATLYAETGETNHHLSIAYPSNKGSKLACFTQHDERAKLSLTDRAADKIILWDRSCQRVVLERVPPHELAQVLRENDNLAVYIGQDGPCFEYPTDVLKFTTPINRDAWIVELRKPPSERKVMIVDPRSATLLGPRLCPTPCEVDSFLRQSEKERSRDARRRVFHAHYTDSLGFNSDAWKYVFSAPPSLSVQPETEQDGALDLVDTYKQKQLPSQPVPSPNLTALSLSPRALRRTNSVHYEELSSDSTESQSEPDVYHPRRSRKVKRKPRSDLPHSTPSSFSSSNSEGPATHTTNICSSSEQKQKVLRDIFPTSSSEAEGQGLADFLAPASSSDESVTLKDNRIPLGPIDPNARVDNSESPSSVLVLNQTPAFELQKLYDFQESGSAKSYREDLDGSGLDNDPLFNDVHPNDNTQSPRQQLRLQIKTRSTRKVETSEDTLPSTQRNGTDPPSSQHCVGNFPISSFTKQNQENCIELSGAYGTNKQQIAEAAEGGGAMAPIIVARPRRRVRGKSPSARRKDKAKASDGITDAQDYMAALPSERICGMDAGMRTRNSVRKEKQIATNEKLGCKRATKNEERAIDTTSATLHPNDKFTLSDSHVEKISREKQSQYRHSCTKGPSSSLPSRRERSANLARSKPNKDHVIVDLKTLCSQDSEAALISEGNDDFVAHRPFPYTSEEVYLWDFVTKKRSTTLMPLGEALERCNGKELMMIYDGQDIKGGDKRFSETWNESKAWIARKGTRPAIRRKVRVWDHCTGKIEQFCFSPAMCNVEQWLRNSSNYSLYKPSLSMQYEHRIRVKDPEDPRSALRVRVRRAIQHQVLNRIAYLRVTELCDGPQQNVIFWNTLKGMRELPRSFSSRAQLTRFLFSNPALELFRGQDEILRLERSTELKLICINAECPADVVTFWDTQRRERCLRSKEREVERRRMVQECLAAEAELEIYVGQDREDTSKVRAIIEGFKCSRALRRSSLPKSWYTLASCGESVHKHVYSKGWVPKFIHTRTESVLQPTFWSRTRKTLMIESLNDPFMSIDEYLRGNPDLELYVGQDMSAQVQGELRDWFQMLQYEDGTERDKAVPTLLRYWQLPLRYRAVRFTTGDEFRGPRKPPKRRRRPAQRPSGLEPDAEKLRLEKRRGAKRQRLSQRSRSEDGRDYVANDEEYSHEEEYLLENSKLPDMDVTKPRSQDTTNYEEENLDGSSGPAFTSSLSSSALDERSSDSSSEDGNVCGEGIHSTPSTDDRFDAEDHIRSATRAVKRMTCVIREAGPKVLRRELMHDVRQTLREQLILEVESVKHLRELVKDFSSHDFAAMANELCEELQLLDIHGCFSCSAEFGCPPNDLSSIREELDTGRICTSEAVIQRFREICSGLMQYHEGTLLHSQASLLRLHGEELVVTFKKLHACPLEKEKKMVRVFRICERARQIGFRSGQRNKKTNQESTTPSKGSTEPALRVSRRQPEVTFLNYRDEKGNSVMGKRPSVRVFGFTIDTNALERQIGNIVPCHVCKRNVILSRADALRCSNRIFGICEKMVCRECLETVFSLERNEFKALRDSENWFCVHCRGLCPSGNECRRAATFTRESPIATLRLKFVWPHARHDAQSVIVVVSKRKLSGDYEPLPESLPDEHFRLTRDSSSNQWYTFLDLSVGAYRCQIMIDKEWNSSSTFQVLPVMEKLTNEEGPRNTNTAPSASVTYSSGPCSLRVKPTEKLATRIKPRGPRIRWYSIPKGPAHPVHAIRDNSNQDGGTLVDQCSRTEGYDWRRAKRHATLQWLPELLSADEGNESQTETQNAVVLCAIDSERVHRIARENPPKPRMGTSHSEFLVTLNTFRYNEMLKSLWSIVTGRSHIHGIGLFTLSGYKKGDFVIEYAGDLIRTPLADIREARYDAAGLGTYLFKVNEDHIVDATVQSNRARFTNHSCDPNMVADIVHVQGRDLIVLRATREISRFTELTFDYKFPYEEAKVQCLCNAWNCVGVMN